MGDIAPGLFFGRLSVYPGQAFFPLAVEATRPSLVASLARDDVEALLMGEPGVLRSVIERLSELTAVLAHRVVGLATLSVRARLHAQLLELGEQAGGGQDGEALLSPAPTQSDLASRLGTSREEVAKGATCASAAWRACACCWRRRSDNLLSGGVRKRTDRGAGPRA